MGNYPLNAWLVDFHKESKEVYWNGAPKLGEKVETVEVNRVNAPTRWARNHALTLSRRHRERITFSITGAF